MIIVIKITEQLYSADGEKRGGADAFNIGGAAADTWRYVEKMEAH